ncbi:hypothetical protein OG226_04100 [Streptomyces sp. NBC_01261]|uniref:hypothetical protein n=1 Tax=unclassified Streptomyces TaxID=2593676 RepID=UPI002E2CB1A8|nr:MULTISPECIES: hypothetical protein [unclassified Streptomyces]
MSGAPTRSPLSESGREFLVALVVEVPYASGGETLEGMTAREDGLARVPAAAAGRRAVPAAHPALVQ